MSEPMFIPVYGSAKDIRMKILENNLEGKFTAMTPLQAIMSGKGSEMSFPDARPENFDDDICFIISTESISESDREEVVSILKVATAPVSVTVRSEDTSDDEEILAALEEEVISSGEDRIERYHRFQDTVNRIRRNQEHDYGFSSVVPLRGKIISHMIQEGAEQTLFLVKFPTVFEDSDMAIPDVQPDPDAPISSVFSVFRLTEATEGSITVDGNGNDIFVTDVNALLFIETMTPCIITAISVIDNDDEMEHEVRSWVIHDDAIDGMPQMASRQVMEEVGEEFADELGLDIDLLHYVWPENISVNQMSVLSPLYDEEVVGVIESQLFGGESDGYDDDDQYEGN